MSEKMDLIHLFEVMMGCIFFKSKIFLLSFMNDPINILQLSYLSLNNLFASINTLNTCTIILHNSYAPWPRFTTKYTLRSKIKIHSCKMTILFWRNRVFILRFLQKHLQYQLKEIQSFINHIYMCWKLNIMNCILQRNIQYCISYFTFLLLAFYFKRYKRIDSLQIKNIARNWSLLLFAKSSF